MLCNFNLGCWLFLLLTQQSFTLAADSPKTSNATDPYPTVFVLERNWSWNTALTAYCGQTGFPTHEYVLSLGRGWRYKMNMKRLRDGKKYTIRINAGVEWCGFDQTYKMHDVDVQFKVYTRGPLPDRWVIKKHGPVKQKYVWHRRPFSVSGPLKNSTGARVAEFSSKAYGADWIRTRFPGMGTYTVLSNGEVESDYLLALFISATVRYDHCHL